jgi:hypothetical protein
MHSRFKERFHISHYIAVYISIDAPPFLLTCRGRPNFAFLPGLSSSLFIPVDLPAYDFSGLRRAVFCGRRFPPCLRPALQSFATHLSGSVPSPQRPSLISSKPTATTKAKAAKGFPPRARKGFPQASALRLCSPRALSAALQGWEIPLPLQLLPPTFARRRSACMSHAAASSKATAKATAQGGSTHEHHSNRRSRHPVHRHR